MRKPLMMTRDFNCGATFSRALAFAAALGSSSDVLGQSIQLGLPIACEPGRTCYIQNYTDVDPSASARDYKCGTLTYDGHNGTDFRLPSLASQRPAWESSLPQAAVFFAHGTARLTAPSASLRAKPFATSNVATAL